jgi:hypothetical protein
MADRPNPAGTDAAESDYQKKFNRTPGDASDSKRLKDQEAAGGDASWKTNTTKQEKTADTAPKKARFGFAGRRRGKLRKGSPFLFIFGIITAGVLYTSIFAPNILLVNLKELYTNDLADATVALNTYYWKIMNYKIGQAQCSDTKSIKCKLSTMSRAQKQAFEKAGFTVLADKVDPNDGRDSGNGDGTSKPESRFKVTAIIPPAFKQNIDDLKSSSFSWLKSALSGNFDGIGEQVSSDLVNMSKQQLAKGVQGLLDYAPLATGDMLYLYSQTSSANKSLVYSVFNPRSSFFNDTRFKQVLKTRYGMTKSLTVGGSTAQAVDKSFDNSVTNADGGIDFTGRPDSMSGVSLGSLSNPISAAQILAAATTLTLNSNSYTGLECNIYSFAKAMTNNAKTAKATTIARYALQYLKEADAIKAGQADMMGANVLSSKLAASITGSYSGQNATDSTIYKTVAYGNIPIPSIYGLLFSLDTYDVAGALLPAWTFLMTTANALAGVTNAPGTLAEPPANLTGTDRQYCLSGETTENKTAIKAGDSKTTKCIEAIQAMAPGIGTDASTIAGETCPPTHYDDPDKTIEGQNLMQPSMRLVEGQLTPIMAGIFGVNVIAWANAESLLFTSQLRGVPASETLFAGTGQVLGDMAMSRGMEPGNVVTMPIYMAQKDKVDKDAAEVASYNAKKTPFDAYNKYSFLGSIVHTLSPTYDSKTPLFSTIANMFSTIGSGVKQLNAPANAIYYTQPDKFDPLRLSCPDAEYLAIGITADMACNVRYAMGKQEMLADPNSVLDYMTKAHPDLTQKNIDELNQRLAPAEKEDGTDHANIQRMIDSAQQAANQPQIDEHTGRPTKGSEFEKYMDYCVNRQDPWGRSAVVVHRDYLPADQVAKRKLDKTQNLEGISPSDSGYPYQLTPGVPYASITEGASADQDWYTGKKCLEQSEELMNFRAYTMLCSVDGSLSGGIDCTDGDSADLASSSDSFLTSNNILYTSW